AAPAACSRATDALVMYAGASVGGAQARRLTRPPSWSTAMRSGSPRVHAARWSSAVTAAAVLRVSQPLPRRITPPILPLRIRVRNLLLRGATSVPMIVSAVSEKPVAARVAVVGPRDVVFGWVAADVTATVAKATRPTIALSIANRVALVLCRSGRP